MSEENVQLVRRVYEAVRRGDTEAVLAVYDPAVEWDFSESPFRDFLKRNVYSGHDGIRQCIGERYDDAWASFEDQVEELIDAGEHVISVVRSRGRGLASGAEVEKQHAGLWTIRASKIIRVAWFGSRKQALAAAGLSEEGAPSADA
ncbi:MAG: nuclear transport factor 2 family protein [Solirubrobacterales bacterium]